MIIEKRSNGYYAKTGRYEGYLYAYNYESNYFYRIGTIANYEENEIEYLLKEGRLIVLPAVSSYIR